MRFLLLFLLLALVSAPAQEVTRPAPSVSPELVSKADQLVQMLRDANDLLSKGNTVGAIAKVNAVLEIDPRSIAAYVLRGAIYSQLKQWDKAQNDYETAHLIDPHNAVVMFDLAEVYFVQKQYDQARPGFVALENDPTSDIGDLAVYKVFLCDLFGNHEDVAAKELQAVNNVGSNPSYYFCNACWSLYHHKIEDARDWLTSANNIYTPQKNGFYASTLFQVGYLPLPPPPATNN